MKHKLMLVKKLIQNHGFFQTIFLLTKMIFYKILNLHFSKKNENILLDTINGKRVIVFTRAIEWNNMFQRIQQMALEFSKCPDTVVIYVETCSTHDFFANIKKINDNLICYSFKHYKKLNDLLKNSTEIILYMTNLFNFDENIQLKHDKMVYEYVDELELFFTTDLEKGKQFHSQALQMSTLCVATATKLLDQIKPFAKKAILSPNAVDYDAFCCAKKCEIATDIKPVISKYDIVLGYYGALANWFDYDTITKVAQEKPNWLFVLIGKKLDDEIEKYNLANYKNILIIPAKPYNKLPSYIAGIDILTIPFVINNITQSTSPVKLFEYMASGTPILTSDLPECKKYKSVYRYKTVPEFISLTQELFAKKANQEYKEILDSEARENTWIARVNEILRAIDE